MISEIFNKYFFRSLAICVVAAAFFYAWFIVYAQGNASVTLKQDPGNSLFDITIKAQKGIREFSFLAPGKSPYGGALSGCPTTRVQTYVLFVDPEDFTPEMQAIITDCQNNITELVILPPKDGRAVGVKKAPPPPPEEVTAAPAEPEEETGELADEIDFPVAELGNCESEDDCRIYCETPSHIRTCLAFAEKYDAMSEEELADAKKFAKVAEDGGPGGCRTEIECQSYCEDPNRIEECVAFAEEYDLLSPEELADAKKFLPLIKSGEMPGGCSTENECGAYCSQGAHLEECIAFAEKYGAISAEELAEARKFLPLIQSGETPGGCDSKLACETYCTQDQNMDECLSFAEKYDVLPPEELEMAKKMLPLIKSGETPGACKSRTSCEEYCALGEHMDECLSFAEKQGLMTSEELEEIKKVLPFIKSGETPGGCMTKADCEAYCDSEENGEECVNFAVKAGFVSEEEAEIVRKTGGKGPGGCRSREQCEAYCVENQEDCMNWAKDNGLEGEFGGPDGGGFSGPGGCTSQEECTAYCQEHQEECQNFSPGGDGGGEFGGPDTGVSFSECVTKGMHAKYVCGINGRGAPPGVETTYFNECHAKQHDGTEILHEGVCIRNGQPDEPCSDVADPVCGNDNNTWVSACHAEDQGGGVQYEGVCLGRSGGGGDGTGGDFGDFNVPPEVKSCVGEDIIERLKRGEDSSEELRAKITSCFQNLQSQPPGSQPPSSGLDQQQLDAPRQYQVLQVPEQTTYYGAPVGNAQIRVNPMFTSEDGINIFANRYIIDVIDPDGIDKISSRKLNGIQAFTPYDDEGRCSTRGPIYSPYIFPEEFPVTVFVIDCQGLETELLIDAPYLPPVPTSPPTSPTNFSGPGGCTTSEECRAYCTQNYQDPACQQFMPYNQPSPSSPLSPSSLLGTILGPWLFLLK